MKYPRVHLSALLLVAFAAAACSSEGEPDDTSANASSTGAATGANGLPATGSAATDGAPAVGTTDLTPKSYAASDPRIQYMGRVDFTDPDAPRFSAPGTTISVRFSGTDVTLLLQDEFKWGNERNFFDVAIDGERVLVLAPEKDVTRYPIATGLTNTEHVLTLSKRTESSLGWAAFQGVEVVGELLDPPARPTRRMMFIGDSITAGSGVEAVDGSAECSQNSWYEAGGWGQPYHNANAGFGAVAARALGAEFHLQAVAGIGLVRNYTSEYDTRPMPEVYNLLYMESETSALWDAAAYVPDAIVIGLGTNDFSPGDDDRDPALDLDMYSSAYVAFVETLLGHYPNAHVFCMGSHMLGDGWPAATDQSRTNLLTSLDMVVAHFAAAGSTQVHRVDVTKVTGKGCGTHIDAAQQAALAQEVVVPVQQALGW